MNRATGVRILLTSVIASVAAAVVAAIFVLGSPAQQRQRRLDERRVRDLSTIANSIAMYASTHDALPADLSVLGNEPGPRRAPTDPDTGAPYEYAVLGAESYRLCAVFADPSADGRVQPFIPFAEREGWAHSAGKQCFDRKQKIRKS